MTKIFLHQSKTLRENEKIWFSFIYRLLKSIFQYYFVPKCTAKRYLVS